MQTDEDLCDRPGIGTLNKGLMSVIVNCKAARGEHDLRISLTIPFFNGLLKYKCHYGLYYTKFARKLVFHRMDLNHRLPAGALQLTCV